MLPVLNNYFPRTGSITGSNDSSASAYKTGCPSEMANFIALYIFVGSVVGFTIVNFSLYIPLIQV